ncbi:MAG: nucleotide sugar dehydrogenase [Paracoccaceae bacterium]
MNRNSDRKCMHPDNITTICVVGLGYVGLPLAVALSRQFTVMGYDVDSNRVTDLQNGIDVTNEVEPFHLTQKEQLTFTSHLSDITGCNVYVVTVPTPIDQNRQPDLSPLIQASQALGTIIQKGDLIIYESTVFPGATEEYCVPALEKTSALKFNEDFTVGYSPERINPGDKVNVLEKITKITSGSTPDAADRVDGIYRKIISAGTYRASSIKIAEAAKVIENTQRDLNIALANELAIICDKLEIDTLDVLEAASTKWNFHHYKPGLVGGHCIGVDPYYLTHKAESVGYYPDVILTGRRINAGMGQFVSEKLIRHLIVNDCNPKKADILLLGFTFKENCPDTRNTRVIDVFDYLSAYGAHVVIYDPYVDTEVVEKNYGIEVRNKLPSAKFDAIMMCVPHDEFKEQQSLIIDCLKPNGFIFDLKGAFGKAEHVVRL